LTRHKALATIPSSLIGKKVLTFGHHKEIKACQKDLETTAAKAAFVSQQEASQLHLKFFNHP
jgi:hypothetical protein